LLFQPTGGTSTTIGTCDAAPSTAAAVEASLVKVESSENKSVCSSSLPVVSTSESSGDRDSAGIQDDRERLTFHVALGESGFASLGISVTKVFRNRRDCGIFIKSVRIGGMAAKVCEPVVHFMEHLGARLIFYCLNGCCRCIGPFSLIRRNPFSENVAD